MALMVIKIKGVQNVTITENVELKSDFDQFFLLL